MHVTEVFTTCMIQRVTAQPYRGVDSPGNHTGTLPTNTERWAGGPSGNVLFWKVHWLVYKKTHIYFLRLQIRFKKVKNHSYVSKYGCSKTRIPHRIHSKSKSFNSIKKQQLQMFSFSEGFKEMKRWTPPALRTMSSAVSVLAYGLLRGLLFPGPPTLGSLVALGWRGILWMGLSRLPRSATIVTLPRMGPPRFLPRFSDVDVDRDMDTESWESLASRCPAHMDFSIWKTARGATFRFSKSTRILNTSGSMAAPAACASSYSSISSAPSTFFRRSASFCSVAASNPVDTASPAPAAAAAAAIRIACSERKVHWAWGGKLTAA